MVVVVAQARWAPTKATTSTILVSKSIKHLSIREKTKPLCMKCMYDVTMPINQ